MLVLLAVFFLAHYLFASVAAYTTALLPALDDLFCERRVQVHGRADHMGSDLGLATIKDLEESRQTLFIAVVVPFARRQIWIISDRSSASGFRLRWPVVRHPPSA